MSPAIRSASLPTEAREHRSTTPVHLDRMEHRVQKHRKMSSTGGGRAWTEEEESYLIRTRMHKMPYKHIAAHLHKTELACRLHYHQMSYGSNRRRRTDSVSSVNSISPLSTTQECPLEDKPSVEMCNLISPPSPQSIHSRSSSVADSPQQYRSHVPILPKPKTSTLHSIQSTPANLNSSLRLDTSFFQSHDHQSNSIDRHEDIDTIRLRQLYNTYRDSFWSLIASDYSKSPSFPAAKLEEAFFLSIFHSYASRAARPPTPVFSPKDATRGLQRAVDNALVTSPDGGFHAINGPGSSAVAELNNPANGRSPVEKCAVASLLTVERDVWAPKVVARP
ncbi:conserved hypothetical protein [Histoplasma capsulatum G186AR]|uniref:Myb-like domain-containing protein n=2 Tax=Ajellomyces capsulatus TaxID=5037 RepID=C0NBK5_AJECG|nr:uncharacterized protein HCBG_00501 [Histoplasma capsulatum G186AR]EEH11046.1 conserved hypothetical protein [Histoplasma capsulatum G186AR]KAG5303104.1 SANT superfamily domain-containing protein [Histoplasma capsulatum]QSS71494.1 SANT superfamily domain-containing protein [Histoplasma capsulatum G186AR]